MLPVETPLPCFLVCSPVGPGTPFEGEMVLWDTLRIVCLALGYLVVIACVFCAKMTDEWGQICRFVAFGVFSLSVIATEYSRLGDLPSARLAINLLGVTVALAGTLKFLYDVGKRE